MPINSVSLSGDEVYALLEEVAYRMPSDPMKEFVLVGGSVLSIYFPEFEYERTTDADVFDKYSRDLPDSFLSYVKEVAKENDLGEDWINDAVMHHSDSECKHNLTHKEYVEFIENYDSPDYFYNEAGDVVFCLYHLSLLGVIAAKLTAGRKKDYDAIEPILAACYNNVSELEDDFKAYALSFTGSPRYRMVIDTAKEIFERIER